MLNKAMLLQAVKMTLSASRIELSKYETEILSIYFSFNDVNISSQANKYIDMYRQGEMLAQQIIKEA